MDNHFKGIHFLGKNNKNLVDVNLLASKQIEINKTVLILTKLNKNQIML